MGIIGRNGAGKTTLLKVLSRITEPTEGRAEIHGRVASLLEIGTGFHPELTGRENIFLSGAILGMKKAEISRKFDEIVEFAEVEKFIETPVKRYSSGMYLRLAFSVAAHLEPEILLVDEVLAVGDAEFQKRCLGKMQDVAGQGRTVLFVSHNMPAVQRLCNRAILLDNGRVTQTGSVQSVIAEYLQSGMQQLGERVWTGPEEAPGDDVVRLRAVRATDAQGQVASGFEVTDPFCIEVEFWVLALGHRLNVALYFYNESGTLMFVTGDFQDGTWQNRNRPVGVHRSKCHVPGNLLNEGSFSILVGIGAIHTLHAIQPDSITIRITDDLKPGGARGNYNRTWPGGVVRPLMSWSFDFEPLDNKETG
jgi:lipopolysaccharide transport system ATP-binding protein